MFLGRDHFKRFVVTQHCKYDVADLVHYCPNSHVLFLAGTFMGVVIINYLVYGYLSCLVQLQVINGDHMEDAPGKA